MEDKSNYKYFTVQEALDAVKRNGLELEFVKEQTPEVCLEAVKEDWQALQFVKNQTPDLCLIAIREDDSALQFVKEQTPEICLEAVKQNGGALQFVKDQTPELCFIKELKDKIIRQEKVINRLREEQSFTNDEVYSILMKAGDYLEHSNRWVRENKKEYACVFAELGSLIKGYVGFSKHRRENFNSYTEMNFVKLDPIPEQYRSFVKELSISNVFALADYLDRLLNSNCDIFAAFFHAYNHMMPEIKMSEKIKYKYFTIEDSLDAVKENGLELKYVKEQTPQIC